MLREDALRRALAQLPEQEREVVKLRYGVGGDDPTPLSETGRRLGISQDTVRRLERKALAELAENRELDALRPAALSRAASPGALRATPRRPALTAGRQARTP